MHFKQDKSVLLHQRYDRTGKNTVINKIEVLNYAWMKRFEESPFYLACRNSLKQAQIFLTLTFCSALQKLLRKLRKTMYQI